MKPARHQTPNQVHVYTHYEVQVFAKSTERRASILFWVLILHGVVFEVHTYHVPLHRKRLRRIVSGLFPELESSILDELLPNKCSLETLRYIDHRRSKYVSRVLNYQKCKTLMHKMWSCVCAANAVV